MSENISLHVTEMEVKSFTCTYDQFNVLLGALISARNFDLSLLAAAAAHPTWFAESVAPHASKRIAHLDALLRSLGVDE